MLWGKAVRSASSHLRFCRRASAIAYMSLSDPTPLKKLTAVRINRQLSCVYPAPGVIRSMLGENGLGPEIPGITIMNGNPVSSHFPVHRACAHSNVKSNGMPFLIDRPRALLTSAVH